MNFDEQFDRIFKTPAEGDAGEKNEDSEVQS